MQSFGKKGEDIAVALLEQKGYSILERNFRCKKSEIDIICRFKGILIFVEVKSRSSKAFGEPEDFVSEPQKRAIIRAAEEYILEHDWHGDIRFDIVAVFKRNNKEEIRHLEDAFY